MPEPDDELPRLMQAGDPDAVRLLVDRFGLRIQRLSRRLCGGHPDAADIAQDVFVVALEKLSTFRGESRVETWLCGITVRLCRKWIRRRMVQRRLFGWLLKAAPRLIESPTRATSDQRSHSELVQAALQQLRPADRELLVLRYLEEYSVDDLANILGIARASVDQRLHRARERLGEWIKEHANE